MIAYFWVDGFRGLKNSDIELHPQYSFTHSVAEGKRQLTISRRKKRLSYFSKKQESTYLIIGENGSGKTSIIDAMSSVYLAMGNRLVPEGYSYVMAIFIGGELHIIADSPIEVKAEGLDYKLILFSQEQLEKNAPPEPKGCIIYLDTSLTTRSGPAWEKGDMANYFVDFPIVADLSTRSYFFEGTSKNSRSNAYDSWKLNEFLARSMHRQIQFACSVKENMPFNMPVKVELSFPIKFNNYREFWRSAYQISIRELFIIGVDLDHKKNPSYLHGESIPNNYSEGVLGLYAKEFFQTHEAATNDKTIPIPDSWLGNWKNLLLGIILNHYHWAVEYPDGADVYDSENWTDFVREKINNFAITSPDLPQAIIHLAFEALMASKRQSNLDISRFEELANWIYKIVPEPGSLDIKNQSLVFELNFEDNRGFLESLIAFDHGANPGPTYGVHDFRFDSFAGPLFTAKWRSLSSGEERFLELFGRLYQFASLIRPYQLTRAEFLLFCFDEPEVGLHPAWQRKIVKYLLDFLATYFPHHITQSIFVSHSPILLTDFPQEHVYITQQKTEEGRPTASKSESPTLAGNIYSLLKEGFLIDGPVGLLAEKRLNDLMEMMNGWKNMPNDQDERKEDPNFYLHAGFDELMDVINQIGDFTKRAVLKEQLLNSDQFGKEAKLRWFQARMEELNNQQDA